MCFVFTVVTIYSRHVKKEQKKYENTGFKYTFLWKTVLLNFDIFSDQKMVSRQKMSLTDTYTGLPRRYSSIEMYETPAYKG